MDHPFETFRRAVEGAICSGLVAQAHGYGHSMSPVTVLFVGLGPGKWARVGIDAGHFHWRETSAVESIDAQDGHTYPVVDLAPTIPVIGREIEAVRLEPDPRGATLSFDFGDRGTLRLINRNDETVVQLAPGGAR